MQYVYYDPVTGQVEAEFDTPKRTIQANWAAKGLLQASVPDGMMVSRDHKITASHIEPIPPPDEESESPGDFTLIDRVVPSENPVQRIPKPRTRLDDLYDRLAVDTLAPTEVSELMRLERKLGG